ncbi:hypothetical protein [Haloferula sp. BvORR071]|uniref:hypothetical protein n=1 Tax=Haloferula sp. BvORR071 TaxID=1396141 RepID=UPI00055220A6|nr:hypothetical protein [Haloferula sp. BvORR071]
MARPGLLAISMLIPATCPAGSISFLPDGKSVARCEKGILLVKDLADEFPASEIKLPPAMGVDTPTLARTAGRLLVGGSDLLMTWNPASTEWKELWRVPEEFESDIDDLACDPKTGDIVLVLRHRKSGELSWKLLPKGETVALKIFNRNAPGAKDPAFDTKGNLYFTSAGDVWTGDLEKSEDAAVPYILFGSRIWPLATKQTSDSNAYGLAAKGVLPFGNKLLVDLSRAGGSGWGNIVRVPNADAYKEGLPLKWEELQANNGYSPLAISPDGKTAATWNSRDQRWWVMEKPDGQFEPLSKEEK